MNPVIIDTSAWIEFFNKSDSKVGDMTAKLIESDKAVLMGVVLAELLCGVKKKRETDQLQELREILPYADTTPNDWLNTGKTLNQLRKQGITIPLTDVLIGTVAKRNQFSVLTCDKHFGHLGVDLI